MKKCGFDFGLNLDKKDVLTIVLLSLIFFSVAVTNLGATKVPSNSLSINSDTVLQAAIVDLGYPVYVNNVYFYIKDCHTSSTIKIYTGQPDDWFESGEIIADYPFAYMNWNNTGIYQTTQYIHLEFVAPINIEINEIAFLDDNNKIIPISSITSENNNSSSLNFSLLIDEQNIVVLPNTYMTETMFDEVYFTRTADQYLRLQWPYEWTHPPLGKLIISTGITAFGLTPFGWRIMGIIFGTLMIPIIFLLGKRMFGSYIGGFSAAFLFTFDFMHFSEARLGITDTYVVFFSLLSHLFFFIYLSNVIKKGWKTASIVPLFLSFVFFAFGFSTKWLILFGFLGELAILAILRLSEVVRSKKDFSTKFYDLFDYPYIYLIAFVIIAICLYFATYIPDMLAGRTLIGVFDLQNAMYAYHAAPIGLDHPYSSPGWSWPIIGKPLWLYVNTLPADMRSTISLFGNPAVWWTGFATILATTGLICYKIIVSLKQHILPKIELSTAFLTVTFFAQWLPYAFVSRGLFIYHYYVNVPIICLGSAYFISKYWKYTWMKIAALIYFTTVIAMFMLFYPVISGTPVLTSTADSLRWFNPWVF
ncbi:MAG: phospholipid carrier-dependent glycosyltransferase [Candidatus Bathyarchaeota archaeon]|uniref:phospholipid carrier-dependent glycosyltransferase n=1 Tax=Candidatus Bathycorpusculum sp. TaxID=2994959 RepID=UPI00282C1128|nr:phospholipid carrier-dependent glycosyltransferase [Candidatus Termiticorpusculum sp.]MCL2257332.1 phospholipid carrier-dependent glycosyltransferase [Candidatus Termiticorpusculum sp.]MCL2292541.1 phospholipid carrier-dependent glycosyltransferase [Candidatus Termiticorpusculum sp.]